MMEIEELKTINRQVNKITGCGFYSLPTVLYLDWSFVEQWMKINFTSKNLKEYIDYLMADNPSDYAPFVVSRVMFAPLLDRCRAFLAAMKMDASEEE